MVGLEAFVDPYITNYGSLINTKKIKDMLQTYIVKERGLGYEYSFNNRVIYITGKNTEEKDIPVFEHPLILETIKGNKLVVIDMRLSLKNVDEYISSMEDFVKDEFMFKMNIIRAYFTSSMLNDEYGIMRPISNSVALSFSRWISTNIYNFISIDPLEKIKIETILMHYILTNSVKGEVTERDINDLAMKISKNRGFMNHKDTVALLESLNNNPKDVNDLIENIHTLDLNGKEKFINTNSIIDSLLNNWIGINASDLVVISLEHIPTFIGLMYVASNSKSFKKAKLSLILDKNSRALNIKDFNIYIENLLKENKV
jgi:hypothetical protein